MNSDEIKNFINSIKLEIENSIESKLKEETSGLLQNIAEKTDINEANFLSMKDFLQIHREEINKDLKHYFEKEIDKL